MAGGKQTGNPINERELVLDTLLMITRDGEYSHIALQNVLEKYQYLEKKERAFITKITEGTLENQIRIDYMVNQVSKTPVNKMKPVIRCIVRSAVYQICFLDNIPVSAACNEAVKLAGKRGFASLKGFVNGVLRNVARKHESGELTLPDETKEPLLHLSINYSMPEWLLRHWMDCYGYDKTREMCEQLSTQAKTCIRVNSNRTTTTELRERLEAEGVTVETHPSLDYVFYISGYDYLAALDSFLDGDFYVQDVSSMMVAEVAAPKEGDSIIDVCAAPGGKSIHIAEKLHGTGHVLARDLTEYKVNLIWDNIDRCQMDNIEAQVWDARVLDEVSVESADIVIADLPCSGLGVIRKKPDIRYKMSFEGLKELEALQREILSVVHRYVKPGGKLIYSTCTINTGENENNVQWFLENHKQFTLLEQEQRYPNQWQDGFFIAAFVKNA